MRTKACPNQIEPEIEPFMNTHINSVLPQSAHETDVHTAGNPLLGFVSRNLTPHVQRFPFPTDSCCWHLFLNQTAVIYGLCVLYNYSSQGWKFLWLICTRSLIWSSTGEWERELLMRQGYNHRLCSVLTHSRLTVITFVRTFNWALWIMCNCFHLCVLQQSKSSTCKMLEYLSITCQHCFTWGQVFLVILHFAIFVQLSQNTEKPFRMRKLSLELGNILNILNTLSTFFWSNIVNTQKSWKVQCIEFNNHCIFL